MKGLAKCGGIAKKILAKQVAKPVANPVAKPVGKGKKRAREESASEDDGEGVDAIGNDQVAAIVGRLSKEINSGFHEVSEDFKAVFDHLIAMSDRMNVMTTQVSTLEEQVRKLRKKRARTNRSVVGHADVPEGDLGAGDKVNPEADGEKQAEGVIPGDEGIQDTTPKKAPLKLTPTKAATTSMAATPTKTPTKNPTPAKNPTPRIREEDKMQESEAEDEDEDEPAEKAKGKEKEGEPGLRVSSLPSPSKPTKRTPSKRIKMLKKDD